MKKKSKKTGATHSPYSSRFVHKISPRATDVGPQAWLSKNDLSDRRALGAALRHAKILWPGGAIRLFRVEVGGRVVAFPTASIWHAIVLEPVR